MKHLLLLLFISIPFCLQAQNDSKGVGIKVGTIYNGSSSAWKSTTGLGLLLEANYFLDDKIRLGYRFEPTALANGEIVYPGGCQSEHPRYPGINSCAEGANFLFNHYLKAKYMLGQPKYGKNSKRQQVYLGAQLVLLTHQRYIITSRDAGNWTDTRQRVTGLGTGIRFGAILGNFDLSTAFTITGQEFRSFIGVNLGYRLAHIQF